MARKFEKKIASEAISMVAEYHEIKEGKFKGKYYWSLSNICSADEPLNILFDNLNNAISHAVIAESMMTAYEEDGLEMMSECQPIRISQLEDGTFMLHDPYLNRACSVDPCEVQGHVHLWDQDALDNDGEVLCAIRMDTLNDEYFS